jgi:hypothetical protein
MSPRKMGSARSLEPAPTTVKTLLSVRCYSRALRFG